LRLPIQLKLNSDLRPAVSLPFMAAAEEAAISRMYGGIHYRPAVENGLVEGRALANYIIQKIKPRREEVADAKCIDHFGMYDPCLACSAKEKPQTDFYSSEFFKEVQLKAVFPDSKTFVDCVPKRDITGNRGRAYENRRISLISTGSVCQS
jgi:hypothetical protein